MHHHKSISKSSLLLSGVLGLGLSIALKRSCIQIVISCGIGVVLLLLNKCTDGGIGEGDGWFFVVSGLYMDWQDNLQLFLSGLFLCFALGSSYGSHSGNSPLSNYMNRLANKRSRIFVVGGGNPC